MLGRVHRNVLGFGSIEGSKETTYCSALIMNSLRLARAIAQSGHTNLVRSFPSRRGYADAVSDKIKLTLALPHQVRFSATYDCSIVLEYTLTKLNGLVYL